MTPAAILALVTQILSLAPTLIQAVAAVKQLEVMITDGKTPTDAEIAALLDSLRTNSDTIADIAAQDAQEGQADPPAG